MTSKRNFDRARVKSVKPIEKPVEEPVEKPVEEPTRLTEKEMVGDITVAGKKVRYWNGERVYDCPECPFDALDQQSVTRHFKGTHASPEPPSKGHLVLTNRFGSPQ